MLRFFMSSVVIGKFAKILSSLPTNERFIIKSDGKFAGMIGLEGVSEDADSAELWYFLTSENEGRGIASSAVKEIEKYVAANKSLREIRARTAFGNVRSEHTLEKNGFESKRTSYNARLSAQNRRKTAVTTWEKPIQKTVEK